jgi:mitochondrial import inner membrane translocase subunit TIM44
MIAELHGMRGLRTRRRDARGGKHGLPRRGKLVDWLHEVVGSSQIPSKSFCITITGLSNVRCRAGGSMVLHKDSAKAERWEMLKQTNPFLQSIGSLHRAYQESENPVVSSLRSVTSTVASWFDETDTAQVTRQLRLMDPTFDLETFTRELREYIVPELVDAYLSADREALQMWCGEAASDICDSEVTRLIWLQTYNVLWATMEQYLRQGLISDSKVLDIRNVDVSGAGGVVT